MLSIPQALPLLQEALDLHEEGLYDCIVRRE